MKRKPVSDNNLESLWQCLLYRFELQKRQLPGFWRAWRKFVAWTFYKGAVG